jgi:sugar-specific transcriptional regulator TrmB
MDQDFLVRTMGLTEEQAFLLLRVASRGQLTAAAAARLMGKSRGRAYELLRGLVAEGLLEELPGRPLMYVARPLADAVAGKRGELEVRAAALRQAEDAFRRTEASRLPAGPGSVSLYWGAHAIHREAARMAQGARTSALVAGADSFRGDEDGFELLLAALARARSAGASVVLLLPDRPESAPYRERAERALGAGHVVTYVEALLPGLSCFVADGEALQCVLGLHGADDEADEALGIKFRGPALPDFLRAATQALLNPSRGPTLEEALALFKALVRGARSELSTLAGQGWETMWPPAEVDGMARLYAEAAERGVAVRTVVHVDGAGPAARLPGEHRVHGVLPAWLAVIDDVAAFQVLRSESGELAGRVSTDPSAVRLLRTSFEHFWADGKPAPAAGTGPEPPSGAPSGPSLHHRGVRPRPEGGPAKTAPPGPH